jgi:hypothetical protein
MSPTDVAEEARHGPTHSPKDLFKNLSDHRKARAPFSRQDPYWFPAIFWKEVHFGDLRGMATLRP